MEGIRFPNLILQFLKGIWKTRDRGQKRLGVGEVIEVRG